MSGFNIIVSHVVTVFACDSGLVGCLNEVYHLCQQSQSCLIVSGCDSGLDVRNKVEHQCQESISHAVTVPGCDSGLDV